MKLFIAAFPLCHLADVFIQSDLHVMHRGIPCHAQRHFSIQPRGTGTTPEFMDGCLPAKLQYYVNSVVDHMKRPVLTTIPSFTVRPLPKVLCNQESSVGSSLILGNQSTLEAKSC